MEYSDILLPLMLGIAAISIPQILLKENNEKLERKIIIIRRTGYFLIAASLVYGLIKYLIK